MKDEKEKPKIRMSSAGLIFKYFGKEVIKQICLSEWNLGDDYLTEEVLNHVYTKMYTGLMLEIDAIDNGVEVAKNTVYHIGTGLGNRVGHMNLPWNAPEGLSQHDQFKKAMPLCEAEFMSRLYHNIHIMMPARQIVHEAWNNREKFNKCG